MGRAASQDEDAMFAYLHECFPDPTKTFVYREVAAMSRLGLQPHVFSIRTPSPEDRAMLEGLSFEVRELPPEVQLRAEIEKRRPSFDIWRRKMLSHWRQVKGDSNRIFEALWLGPELRRLGVRHVHAHFAGLAARTAWLVHRVWGIGFSFTGHADDIFSPTAAPITLNDLVSKARFVATETDYSRTRLEREFPAARGKTFRVFNGIEFDAPTERLPQSVPRVVSVGRLVEKKGFSDLLSACARLRDAGLVFACDIIGGGPLEPELRELVSELKLGTVVTMHGAQPQSRVREILAKAQLFALACRTEGDGGSDNLPTVIMEAMAAGLPVVSTRVAGVPEMVEHSETGFLAREGDVTALAEAIGKLLGDAPLAARLGETGRERAIAKFSVDRSAAALADLLVHRGGVVAPEPAVNRCPSLRTTFFERLWQRLARR